MVKTESDERKIAVPFALDMITLLFHTDLSLPVDCVFGDILLSTRAKVRVLILWKNSTYVGEVLQCHYLSGTMFVNDHYRNFVYKKTERPRQGIAITMAT